MIMPLALARPITNIIYGGTSLCEREHFSVTASNYNYDTYDRVTSVTHTLNGTTRTSNYGYDDDFGQPSLGKRGITPTSPENNKGEVFSYDLARSSYRRFSSMW